MWLQPALSRVSGVAACPRAALIYLCSSAERQRALASEVGKNAKTALGKPKGKLKRSGARMARSQGKADESQQHTGHMAADLGFDRRPAGLEPAAHCLDDFMPLTWRPRMGETWGYAAR